MGKGKNKKKKVDDLAAVREVVDTLKSFDRDVRERIIRWAHEKLDALAPSKRPKSKKKSKKKAPAKKKSAKKKAPAKKKSAKKKAPRKKAARKTAKRSPSKKTAKKKR